jgi:cell division protein FtsW
VRNGSRSWFKIASFGIQPSEFTKLALIIFTSKYLTKYKKMLPILLLLGFIFGLIMLQPDFGTGVVLVMSILGILFIGGMNISFIFKMSFLGILGIIGLIIIAPYRLARILSFLNPWSDPLGSGFQIIQSLYAIGPGGLFGMGIGNSIQKYFYLPEPQTDFIFAIISEELGFMGVLIVITLLSIIIFTGFKIALKTTDLFGKYLSFGISFSLAFQAILNLMVVVGLIPVTGVTLPFLSYGGSSLLISMVSIGVILNIASQHNST